MFSKKTACFVTGASRGLGESIATNFARQFPEGSLIVLLARTEGDLETVRKRLQEKSPHVTAVVHRFDQSTQDAQHFRDVFSHTVNGLRARPEDFRQAMFIHNAATIEPIKFIRNLPPVQDVTQYLCINFSGVVALTTEFLKFFPTAAPDFSRVIVNISANVASAPKSWAMYNSVKAARVMFFKTLAAEEEGVRVLNYAPGPLVTGMVDTVIATCEDEEFCTWAKDAKANHKLLPCDTSVAKLMDILEKDTFESGAHIDYYDDI